MTASNTSLFDMNSQTPSEAITINLSCSSSSISQISGSQITPTGLTISSPKDQLIARPGISISHSQTQYGPSYCPVFGSIIAYTHPPAFNILAFSIS